MIVTVVVPTYRRPADLKRCLLALEKQARAPDEVIVVTRPDDKATQACLQAVSVRGTLPLIVGSLEQPGQVAALNRGLDLASGDVIAITDDDAAPRSDWLARIVAAFAADARLGGLGGRDWVHERGRVLDDSREIVGKVTWSGRVIGNHHLGVGGAREVDVLKGANMSYRHVAIGDIRFDTRLRGTGAQVHNDLAFSMRVKQTGWKLVYDSQVAVDHFPSERFDDSGRRDAQTLTAVQDAAYNLHLILREQLSPLLREVAWWWHALIGTRLYPGAAHVLLALLAKRGGSQLSHWRAVRSGAWEARREAASHMLDRGRAYATVLRVDATGAARTQSQRGTES